MGGRDKADVLSKAVLGSEWLHDDVLSVATKASVQILFIRRSS
jgi:hypothetical protein